MFICINLVLLYLYSIQKQSHRGFLYKVVFKILRNLQEENTCARVSFEAPLATSLKWRRRHRCFPVNFCEIFKNIPPPLAASFYHKMLNIKIHRDSYMQQALYLILSIVSEATGFYLLKCHIQNLVENLRWRSFAKIVNSLKAVNYFRKKRHRSCSTGF